MRISLPARVGASSDWVIGGIRAELAPDRESHETVTVPRANDRMVRMWSKRLLVTTAFTGVLSAAAAQAQVCYLERISLNPNGSDSDNHSGGSSLSRDGRFVAFASAAANLIAFDTNNSEDVFVHDRVTGLTERISVDSFGNEADIQSNTPSISADGRYVVFSSWARNLVPGDTNNTNDVFLRDRVLGTTTRVSVDANGAEGNYGSYQATISKNGRWIAFLSSASTLVPGDVNDARDVFLVDRELGGIELISVSSTGAQGDAWAGGSQGGPVASEDGRYVFFQTPATNMVVGDTNGVLDVFVRDRVLGTTSILSVGFGGAQSDGQTDVTGISADARFVALVSLASNLVPNDTNGQFDSFVLDRSSGVIERVSVSTGGQQASGSSWSCTISEDGRFAIFTDTAPDLDANDTNGKRDVFRRDRITQTTTRVSVSITGIQADADCVHPSISGDGTTTGFTSAASGIVVSDSNSVSDVFVETCKPADLTCFGTSATCPCGNVGDANAGCASQSLPGARLYALGGPFVSNDTLTLVVANLPQYGFAAFFEGSGPTSPSSGLSFGDGKLCLAGPFQTLGLRHVVTNSVSFGFLPGEPLLSVMSGIPSGGDVRHYQVWYRSAENFCTSATFNLSNAATVQWYP